MSFKTKGKYLSIMKNSEEQIIELKHCFIHLRQSWLEEEREWGMGGERRRDRKRERKLIRNIPDSFSNQAKY